MIYVFHYKKAAIPGHYPSVVAYTCIWSKTIGIYYTLPQGLN